MGVAEEVLFAGYRLQLYQGIAFFSIVVVLSLMLAHLIGRRISQPLQGLVAVADAVEQGDRAARAKPEGGDEIARVAEHLNRMLDALMRSERALRMSIARSRELSGRLLNAEEGERKRLAHDLHDQVGQELTALKIRIEMLGLSAESQAMRPQLAEIAAAAGETLQRVRQMSVDLRPPQLDSLGLAAALRAHVDRQGALGKIALHFDSRGFPRDVPADIEIVCFRVVQEALTNAMRHSGASNAWVELRCADGLLSAAVRDDGAGFDAARVLESGGDGGGFGLAGMHERVALVGGVLDIRSQPGQGCTVTASFAFAGTPESA